MKTDGAHSRQLLHSRKRQAPESSQVSARPASKKGRHDDGLCEPTSGSGSTSCHPTGHEKTSESKLSPFSDLPAVLKREVCSHLKGDPHQKVRDLAALRRTSRVLSESLRDEGYLWSSAQELEPLVREVKRCFREMEVSRSSLRLEVQGTHADQEESHWISLGEHEKAFGPALAFLSPRQRGTLVEQVGDIPDEYNRSMVIESLGRELAHLEVPQRENLVDATLKLTEYFSMETALRGLASSLEHLDSSQREKLVAMVIKSRPGALLILALGPKLALLKETQCKALVKAAADLDVENCARAIVGLFKGLADLDPALRETIIQPAVLALEAANANGANTGSLWPACLALRPGAEYFSESLREGIIASACEALSGADGFTIRELAPAMEYIGKLHRDAMFNSAINLQREDERARALRGLGMCIAHLDEAQREALLRAASSISCELDRAWAIEGIAGGVAHLGEDGRNTLIAEVKRFKYDGNRGISIRGFGENDSLQHLSPGHRQELVAAATNVASIIGLAKGSRYLAQPERGLLLEAARRQEPPRLRAVATAALAKATSEALLFREPDMRES